MALCSTRSTRRVARSLACLGGILFLLHSLRLLDFPVRRYDTWPWKACSGFEQTCAASTIASDTVVVVKTGGSEPQSRLHSQLATLLSKIPRESVIIFSDNEEQVGSYHVHDVFTDVSEEERATYPEFALYDAQKEYQRQGIDIRSMGLEGGWDLAKYMNLAMIRRILENQQEAAGQSMQPKKWFVFIDTDTFVMLKNLFTLLEHLNAAEPNYIGSPVWLPKLQFAHGGSAYVLSYSAMEALESSESSSSGRRSQFGFNTTKLCCGDEALARALKPKGVVLKGYWPMFNGELPATLSFGKDLWCEPVISLHHLNGEEMRSLWQWIEGWEAETSGMRPLLFKYLFDYVAPSIAGSTEREDWDSIDESFKIYPKKRTSRRSFEHCKVACEEDKACFQFVFDSHACALSHHIRLGRERVEEANESDQKALRRYRSGWIVPRIRE